MTNKLEQIYQDQIIKCKGLSLLKVMGREIDNLLTKEEQKRLPKLREIELLKLIAIERELKHE